MTTASPAAKAAPKKATSAPKGKATPKAPQNTPKETPVVAPENTPEETPETLLDFAAFSEKEDEEGTYITNVALASDAFQRHADAAVKWDPADAETQKQLGLGAESVMDLRSTFELPSGIPDWAGNSPEYAKAFNAQFVRAVTDAGMDKARIEDWRTSLRVYMSRTRFADTYIAQYITKHSPTLPATPVKVGKVEKTVAEVVHAATKESKIPQPVRAEMQKHFSAQRAKNKADGTPGDRLAGFKVVPTQFGVKPPAATKAPKVGNTGHIQPSGLWEKLIAEVGKLDPLAATNKLRELATALSDAHIGAPGKVPEGPAVGKDGIRVRDEVTAAWRELSSLSSSTADVIEPMDGATKDHVAAFRYTPDK